MWVILAFLTALSWGLGRVVLKPAYKYFSEAQVYLFNALAFFITWIMYILITQTPIQIPLNLYGLLPLLPPLSFLLFIIAMNKAKVSTVTAVGGTLPLMTTLLAVVFLGENLSLIQFLLIIVIAIGLTMLGFIEKKNSTKLEWQGFLWGLIATLGFGVSNTASKFAINEIGSANFSLINGTYMLIISFFWLLKNNDFRTTAWQGLKQAKARFAVFGDMVYGLGGFFMFSALQTGLVSLVIPITNTSVLISTLFAVTYLKEKIGKKKLTIIATIFISTTLLVILN